jgi:hypothetical protein
MAKHGKTLPARKPRDRSRDDDSILLRSAESLGRVIGSLQRQLDGAKHLLSETADDAMEFLPDARLSGDGTTRPTARKRAPKKKAARKTARAAKAAPARTASRTRKTSRR